MRNPYPQTLRAKCIPFAIPNNWNQSGGWGKFWIKTENWAKTGSWPCRGQHGRHRRHWILYRPGKATERSWPQLSQPLKTWRGICFLCSLSLPTPHSQAKYNPFVLSSGAKENRWSPHPLNFSMNYTKPSVFLEGQYCVHNMEWHIPVCPSLANITDHPSRETHKGTGTDVFNLIQQTLIQCLHVHGI